MEEEKRSKHGESNRHDALCCPPSDTASFQTGLIKVSVIAPNNEFEYEHFIEWRASRAELSGLLESLRHYEAIDCKVSLADYTEPEHDIDHIAGISQCVVYIPHNENFYYGTTEEAAERIIECCYEVGIPMPAKIDYVINGYYVRWKFNTGFSRNELPIWEFVQRALHDRFAGIGADPSVIQDATSMLYAPGFINSNYVGFDLNEKVLTVHNSAVQCRSPHDFVISLPLNVSEAKEYRKTRASIRKSYSKGQHSPAEIDTSERIRLMKAAFATALKIEGCGEECYRFRQYKAEDTTNDNAEGKPKRKKYYDWLKVNSTSNHYGLKADRDNWLSAALFGEMYNQYSGQDALHKEEKYAVSVDCNFVILKWEKSELDFIPTPEQGKELVLSICRKIGLPEPRITYTADGLEVKWYWRDRMTKEHPDGNWFNHDWYRMQEELFKKFWYLGAEENGILTMFRVHGSLNTAKKLKTDDRVVRDIHEGEIVSSYRDIQRMLGLTSLESEPVESEPVELELEQSSSEELLRQDWESFSRENSELVKDWMRDVLAIHPSGNHWVCVSTLKGKGKWTNHYEQACNLPTYLMRFSRTPEFNKFDIYVSQGEFLKFNNRKISNLASIRVSFVDLDYSKLKEYRPDLKEKPTAEEWKELVVELCDRQNIPYPSVIVFTGNGVHLKWIYVEAVTGAEREYWEHGQKLLHSQFKTLGSDSASLDASRVLRLVGTHNHKEAVNDREVRVISEVSPAQEITLKWLIDRLEASKPVDLDNFNAIVAEWAKCGQELMNAEAEDYSKSIQCFHSPEPTFLQSEVSGGQGQCIEASQTKDALRSIHDTPNVSMPLSGMESREHLAGIAGIPSNYIELSRCPGATFEEQKANILRHCHEYRDVGIPEPNQIIRIGAKLLVKWIYASLLPVRALSRWKATQEYLCHYFEDWGAMDNPEHLKATALLPEPGVMYDGEMPTLEYNSSETRYTFNRLANAVLPFSQAEVRIYEAEKAKRKAKWEAILEMLKELASHRSDIQHKAGNFGLMARKRLQDIITLLEIRKDSDDEVPQGTRELCVFWAMEFAMQGGLISAYDKFEEKAQELIGFCGEQFKTECSVSTVASAFRKIYRAKTTTLIDQLQITPAEQEKMKVLIITKNDKKRQPRKEWLAEHDQERRKPWIELGISRATYFRWRKAGKLPGQVRVYDSPIFHEEKNETGISYIMIAAFIRGGILMCRRYLEYESVCLVQEGGPDGGYIGLRRLRVLRWLVVKSKLYLKRRRRSRPRRKRKREWGEVFCVGTGCANES